MFSRRSTGSGCVIELAMIGPNRLEAPAMPSVYSLDSSGEKPNSPRQIESLFILVILVVAKSRPASTRPVICFPFVLDRSQRDPARGARLAGTSKVRGRWAATRHQTVTDSTCAAFQRAHVGNWSCWCATDVCKLPKLRRRAHRHEFGRNLCRAGRGQARLLTLWGRGDHRRRPFIVVRRR